MINILRIPVLVICLFVFCGFNTYAQIDRTFWFAAPDISVTHGQDPITIRVTAFNTAATVTVSMPANPSFTPFVLNVPANTTVSQDMTPWLAQIETPFDAGGLPVTARKTGILLESTANISAYYEVNRSNNPDIFALKGKNALGQEFYLPLQNVWNHQALATPGRSGFVVVATEDNTVVTITPTRTLEGGRTLNVPYTVTLNRGESYSGTVAGPISGSSAGAANMPAGTKITSDKPVAVTMFHDSINTSNGGCYDLAGDQLVPVNILGKEYGIVRSFLGFNGSSYSNNPERVVVMATQASTQVTWRRTTDAAATVVNLATAGAFTIINLTDAHIHASIVADKPIYVFHFGGFGCETGGALVPPLPCTGSRSVRFTRSTTDFFGVFILVKDTHIANFTSNFLTISPAHFQALPNLPGWVAARYDNVSTASLAAGATGSISNSSGLFHVGIINGGASSGTRYGYFSSFNSVNLGADINVSFGTNILLDAGPNGITYKWFRIPDDVTVLGTSQTLTVSVFTRGSYRVEVEGNDCVLRDTICIGTFEYVWEGGKDTNVNDPANWSVPCGLSGVPDCNYDVIIPPLSRRLGSHWPVLGNNATFSCRDLSLFATSQMTMNANSTLNICRHFRHEGAFNAVSSATVRFIGTVPQNYEFFVGKASGELPNVVLNNTTPLPHTFQTDAYLQVLDSANSRGNLIVQSNSTFTFQNGYVRTQGQRELVIKNRASNGLQGYNEAARRFVAGRLRRYTNSLGSYDFPVGLVKNINNTTIVNSKQGTLRGNNGNLPTWQTANYSTGIGTTTVLDFNPTHNQYIELPAAVAIAGNAPRTVEMWARIRDFSGERGLFALGSTGTSLQDFSLRVNNGSSTNLNFRVQLWGSDIDVSNPPFIINNEWAHYAVTYDGATVRFYINGQLAVQGARNLNTVIGVENFLARWRNGYMNGQMDEVRIWNVARSQAEIDAGRNQLIDRCNPPAGLVAYYDFEEGSGNVINHRTAVCSLEKQYQLANVTFTTTSGVDNLLAYFNSFTPPTLTGLPLICNANFNCQMLNHGFWTINAFNAANNQITTSGNYNMTLYNRHYSNFGITCNTGTTVSATIVRRADGASPWQIGGGFCVSDNPNNTARSGMTGFSDFGTGQSPNLALLPVELIDFSARKQEKSVLLQWQTVSERGFNHFVLEKSRDGNTFFELAKVNGKGENGAAYEWTDTEPARVNYYRLKMVDKDGTFEYSKIVVVTFDDWQKELQAYPNPLTKGNGFFVNEAVNKISRIAVYNLLGQLIYQGVPQTAAAEQDAYVPANMSSGVYLVQIMLKSGDVQTVRLVVQ